LEIVDTNPRNNDGAVAVDAAIMAVFNKPVDPTSLNTTSFSLSPGAPGKVAFDLNTLTASFKPIGPLAAKTTFTATLNSGVTDLTGNNLPSNFSFTFTTEDPSNRIQLISPDNGATGLDSANVVLQFKPFSKNADKAAYSIFVCENENFAGCEA